MHGQRQEKPAVAGFCGALPCLRTVIHRPKGTASVKDGEHVVGFAVNELLDPQQVVLEEYARYKIGTPGYSLSSRSNTTSKSCGVHPLVRGSFI